MARVPYEQVYRRQITPEDGDRLYAPANRPEVRVAEHESLSNPHSQYLTTAAASNHSHGNPTLALTNLSGTTASNSAGLTLSLSAAVAAGGGIAAAAGSQTQTSGTLVFADSNGLTFGMSGSSQITASHNGLTTAMASNAGSNFVAATAGFAGTNASGTIASNGISVSIGNYITTAMASNRGSDFVQATAGFAGTNASGTIASNGISVSVGNYITTAMASNRGSDFVAATAAFAGTSASGTIASNGISISIGPYLTTAAQSNHSHGNPTLALTNLSGTTASNSAGLTLSLSAAAPGAGGGIAAAAGTQTATSGTVAFANSNGITFGMSGSTQITASHNGLTTAAASDHSHGNPTLALTNLSGTTASASNGLTLSLSAAAPGGGAAVSNYFACPPWGGNNARALLTNITALNGRPIFLPFQVAGTLTFDELMWMMSRSTSGSNSFVLNVGVYSYANHTSAGTVLTQSAAYSHTATASISGIRMFEVTWAATQSLGPGQYLLAMHFTNGTNSTNSTASMNYSLLGGTTANPYVGVIHQGTDAYTTATTALSTHQELPMWGRYTTTTNALPTAIQGAHVIGAMAGASAPLPLNFTIGRHV